MAIAAMQTGTAFFIMPYDKLNAAAAQIAYAIK